MKSRTLIALLIVLFVVETALGIGANIATSLLPNWTWLKDPVIVWGILGAVFVIALILIILTVRGEVATEPAPIIPGPRDLKLVSGSIPVRPPDWVSRTHLAEIIDHSSALPHVTVLLGPVATGKSDLAAAYARDRMSLGWGRVLWVEADSDQTVLGGLAGIGTQLGLATPTMNSVTVANAVRDYLQTSDTPTILVFDGAVSAASFSKWIPAGRVHVVLTTNVAALAALGTVIPVAEFESDQAVEFLRRRLPGHAEDDLTALANHVDNNPLALAQASFAILHERQTVGAFLAGNSLAHAPQHGATRSIAEAISSSASAFLAQAGSASGSLSMTSLLRGMALLGPAPVRLQLLVDAGRATDAESRAAYSAIADWSLATWSSDSTSVTMHALTARIIRASLTSRDVQETAESLAKVLEHSTAEPRYVSALAEMLWKNSREHLVAGTLSDSLIGQRLGAADRVFAAGGYTEAMSIASTVLDELGTLMAPSSAAHLRALNLRAHAHLANGDAVSAVALYRASIKVHRSALGRDDPATVHTQIELGNALRSAKRLSASISLLNKVLKRLDPSTSKLLHAEAAGSLAFAYLVADKPKLAIPLLEKVIPTRIALLGADSQHTLTARHTMARARWESGDQSGGLRELESLFADKTRVFGEPHPQTLVTAHYLGLALVGDGQRDRGIALLTDTYARRIAALGALHPDSIATAQGLSRATST